MTDSNSIWRQIKRVLIVFPYKDASYFSEFRRELDKVLNDSLVEKLDIVVTIPASLKKADLPTHRLIHFVSPKDFTLFGKLKNEVLGSVITKSYDALLYFEDDSKRLGKALSEMTINYSIGINSPLDIFTIRVFSKGEKPEEMVNFAKNTLVKLSSNE